MSLLGAVKLGYVNVELQLPATALGDTSSGR